MPHVLHPHEGAQEKSLASLRFVFVSYIPHQNLHNVYHVRKSIITQKYFLLLDYCCIIPHKKTTAVTSILILVLIFACTREVISLVSPSPLCCPYLQQKIRPAKRHEHLAVKATGLTVAVAVAILYVGVAQRILRI